MLHCGHCEQALQENACIICIARLHMCDASNCIKMRRIDVTMGLPLQQQLARAQVGSFELDRAFWGRPELMNMSRPVALINAVGSPGTDLLASTAAALAAGGMALADDAVYSTRLIVTAQQLYGCDLVTEEEGSPCICSSQCCIYGAATAAGHQRHGGY